MLPERAYKKLDQAQKDVVDYLDGEIDSLRVAGGTPGEWERLYGSLMKQRKAIDALLVGVTKDLKIRGRFWGRHIEPSVDGQAVL